MKMTSDKLKKIIKEELIRDSAYSHIQDGFEAFINAIVAGIESNEPGRGESARQSVEDVLNRHAPDLYRDLVKLLESM